MTDIKSLQQFEWFILFQNAIASHESNGIDIIIALILNDINPLGKQRMDLVLELKVKTPSVLNQAQTFRNLF